MIQFGRTSLAELRVWSFEYISYLKQTIEYYWNGYWKYLETVFESYSVRRFYAWYLEQISYDFIIPRKYKCLVGYSKVYSSKALHTVSKRKKKKKLTLLNSAKVEIVWWMKCIVVSCITLVFFERPSAITLRSDLAPLGFFLIAMTRSKSVKRFNCVDLNEEKTKQYMPDQLLTRRNKPIICFFLVFFLLAVCLID